MEKQIGRLFADVCAANQMGLRQLSLELCRKLMSLKGDELMRMFPFFDQEALALD